jgi:hypothetical protein
MSDEPTKLKRFVVMGGDIYYAAGGFEDYLNSFDTKDEAMQWMEEWIKDRGYSWAHVGDIETGDYWIKGEACSPMKVFR